jgi:hypothetical protein
MIEVEGPDGRVHEFPEGTKPDVIKSVMARTYGPPKTLAEEGVNALKTANQFMMLGGGDEYTGAANTAIDLARGKIGLRDVPSTFESYRSQSDRDVRDFKARRPVAGIAAEAAGGLVTLPLAARSVVGRAAQTATPLADAARKAVPVGAAAGALSADPGNRGVGAATGAVTAPVAAVGIQGGLQALPGLMQFGRAAIGNFTATPQQKALRMTQTALQEGGAFAPTKRGTTAIQARSNALVRSGGGVQETIGEIGGPSAKGLSRAVANVPGPGQKIALDTLEQRREGMAPRVLKTATNAAGKPQTYGDVVVSLRTTGKQAASKAYDTAMDAADQVVVPKVAGLSKELDDFLYDVQAGPGLVPTDSSLMGLQRARSAIGRLEELASSGRLSLRAVERIRQQINTIARGTKGDAYDGFATRQALGFFDKKLDDMAAQNPQFAQALGGLKSARQGYGTTKQTDEAVQQGLRALSDDATDTYLWMNNDGRGRTQAEADGYMVGVVRAITNAVNRSDTAAIARINRDKNIQAALVQAMGDAPAKKLLTRINREANMQAGANAITSGSRTTPLREEVDRWTKGEDDLAFLSDLIQNPAPIRTQFLRFFSNAYDRLRRPGLYNPRISEEVAKIMYAPATPKQVQSLLAQINADPVARQALQAVLAEQAAARAAPATGVVAGQYQGQQQ